MRDELMEEGKAEVIKHTGCFMEELPFADCYNVMQLAQYYSTFKKDLQYIIEEIDTRFTMKNQ